MLTTIVAIAAGVGGALMRDYVDRATVVLWGIAAPVATLIVVATIGEIFRRR